MPVYNGEKYVAEAIQSILDQDFSDFELIITDNASTDGTEAICREFAARDQRIRYVRNPRNLGAGGNFNHGFELSSGEFFKWSAHDDFISRNFLSGGVRALEENPDAVVAYCCLQYVDINGNVTPQNRTLPDMRGMPANRRFQALVDAAGFDNAMFGVFRRSALIGSSMHRPYYMSDRALLTEIAMRGIFIHVPDIVLYNRDHPDRSIRLINRQARALWQSTSPRSKIGIEHFHQLAHEIEIAYRYRHVAPLYKTLPRLMLWVMHPMQLARYGLELFRAAKASLRLTLKRVGWQTKLV
jgi:glycosyltransferase involved in cell wall biosynthesis